MFLFKSAQIHGPIFINTQDLYFQILNMKLHDTNGKYKYHNIFFTTIYKHFVLYCMNVCFSNIIKLRSYVEKKQ